VAISTENLVDITELSAMKKAGTNNSCLIAKPVEVVNMELGHIAALPLQIRFQQLRLRDLIEQKSGLMTPRQVQRLQDCVQQIEHILSK